MRQLGDGVGGGRLDHIEQRFGGLARDKGLTFVTIAPSEFESPAAFDARLREIAPEGFTDIGIMAPVAPLAVRLVSEPPMVASIETVPL